MSFKLFQFAPLASTRTTRVPVRWIRLDANSGGSGFLGAWLVDENDSEQQNRRINWGAIAGLATSFVISGAFWAGVGVLISRMVR